MQDHRFFKWDQSDLVFDIEFTNETRCACTADGFGVFEKPDSYGNGKIYTDIKNIEFIGEVVLPFVGEGI